MVRIGKSGIKRNVLFVALLPAAMVAIFLTLYFSYAQSNRLEESLNERGISIIRQLAPASEYGVYSGNVNILQNLIESVKREADVRSVTIRNREGVILVETGPESHKATGLLLSNQKIQNVMSDNGKSMLFNSPIFQVEFIKSQDADSEEDIIDDDKPELIQTSRILGWVSVELSMERTHAFQMKNWTNTTLISLSILILIAFLAVRMGRKITYPITELKNAVSELAGGNLEVQVKTDATGEIKSLEDGINSMASALKTSHLYLEEKIEEATSNLLNTLSVLEERNTELDSARRDAENANKSKSEFLANISHEIRTPLNGIQGFLLLLQRTRIGPDQNEYLDKIDISTKNLLTLINDILDFSKIEAAKVSINKAEYNIRILIQQCVDICIPDIKQKGLETYIIIEPEVPNIIIGDSDRVSQIIKNLVSNAVKFTNEGHILIQIRLTAPHSQAEQLVISVTDTGIGISQDDISHLFQPFSQLESGMDRRYGGTGLGLTITKSLTEIMGGEITVESTPKSGSCFTISLPLQKVTETHPDKSLGIFPDGLNICIISKDKLTIRSLQTMLTHWNIRSSVSSSIGEDFLTYDAIIFDENFEKSYMQAIDSQRLITNEINHPYLILLRSLTSGEDNISREDNNTRKISDLFDKQISRPVNASEIIDLFIDKDNSDNVSGDKNIASQRPYSNSLLKELNVLVADDNDINRQFLVTWLSQSGATVDEAENGREAIQYCSLNTYNLILMDLHMPEIDGIEAASVIRNNRTLSSQSPIIAITADATDSARQTILQSSLDDLIIKPVSENQLIDIISQWCPNYISSNPINVIYDYQDESLDNTDIVDIAKGIQLASGDKKMWYSSLSLLISRLPGQQSEISDCIVNNDYPRIADIAHSISGAASYCGAINLTAAAKELEAHAKAQEIANIKNSTKSLGNEINHLMLWSKSYTSLRPD